MDLPLVVRLNLIIHHLVLTFRLKLMNIVLLVLQVDPLVLPVSKLVTVSQANSTITVELTTGVEGLNVDTTFQVNGVSNSTYNGSFVSEVVSVNSDNEVTEFKYKGWNTIRCATNSLWFVNHTRY